jgi:hypothetical protein
LQAEDELEYGLIVLWEMLDNQALYIEGREADVFSMLLSIRYCNKQNVSETCTIPVIIQQMTRLVGPGGHEYHPRCTGGSN